MNKVKRDRALLVFARNPVAGQVKTRLIPALGAEGAVAVYRRLLAGTLAAAHAANSDTLSLWIDQPSPNAELLDSIAAYDTDWHPQSSGDLGARMQHAFESSLAGHRHVVLIGSDCPEFSAAYLHQAFDALQRCDLVIGPASDGGYVLIGMNTSHAALFESIPWSTDRVLAVTRQRLAGLGLSCHELPALRDIDTADDLRDFPELRNVFARRVSEQTRP